MIMGLKVMGVKCVQVVNNGQWQGCILSFTFKRLLSSSSSSSSISSSSKIPRLKREDVTFILHHSSFSQWKILIGASDWKDHSTGKEGAERYRTQNLPNYTSAGAYELGVATSAARNLDPASVVPVYVGQADNVRARLQSYGRDGDHLEKASLFSDVFSIGLPVVYRCAPMESKAAAGRREEELLGLYDYAWNKRNNGDRRPHHIQARLARRQSLLSILGRWVLQCFQLGHKFSYPRF